MEAKAILRGVRLSPQKARLVVDVVRGKPVNLAIAMLNNMPQKAAAEVARTIKSAAANAENNLQMTPDDLVVKTIFVDEGPAMKRVTQRARGRANILRHRTSHITVIVDDGEGY